MKKPIGLIIRKIIEEKNLEVIDVARKMNMTRQNVYQTFGRQSLSEAKIEMWAKALSVSSEVFNQDETELTPQTVKADDYLMRYIDSLEKRIAEQEKVLTVLLGKSEQVSTTGFAVASPIFLGQKVQNEVLASTELCA